jgi:hypothetical protein
MMQGALQTPWGKTANLPVTAICIRERRPWKTIVEKRKLHLAALSVKTLIA